MVEDPIIDILYEIFLHWIFIFYFPEENILRLTFIVCIA